MKYTRQQVETISKNRPEGVSHEDVIASLLAKGNELEGIDTQTAQAFLQQRQPQGIDLNAGLKPTVSELRQQRIDAGLPVSSNEDRVEPTLAGNILRGAIKAPIKAGLAIAAPFAKDQSITVNSEYLGDTSDPLTNVNDAAERLAAKVNSGEITLAQALAGVIGQSALETADIASAVPVGGSLLSAGKNTAVAAAKGAVPAAISTTKGVGTSLARGAAEGALYDVGSQVASGEKFDPMQTVQSAGVGALLDTGLSQGLPRLASGAKNALTTAKNNLSPEFRMNSIIEKRANDILDIENNYSKTRKAMAFSDDEGNASRQRVANTDVLVDSVDQEGRIRTKGKGGPIEQYKKQTIDGREGIVRKDLEREGVAISPNLVRKQLQDNVMRSGLEGKALKSALNSIESEMDGLMLRADTNGNIPLTAVHDAKIATTSGIDFNTEAFTKRELKAKAAAFKEVVENQSSLPIKQTNAELAKFYKDIELLENLDGKKVKGGKLGKYFAQISGNMIGGAVGSVGGPIGSAAGAIIGGEATSALQGNSMSRTFGSATGKTAPKSAVLRNAEMRVNSPRIGLPAPQVNSLGNRKTKYSSTKTTAKNSIPKVSNKSIPKSKNLSTDLVEEAKKYKSADEFELAMKPFDIKRISKPRGNEVGSISIDVFPNKKIQGQGITKDYLLHLLKIQKQKNGIGMLYPHLGTTKDGSGFLDNLTKSGFLKKKGAGYEILDTIDDYKSKLVLKDIWKKANKK